MAKASSKKQALGFNDKEDRNRHALHEQNKSIYKRLLAAKKKADADLRNHGKTIKSELGEFGLDMIKLSVRLDEGDENDANEVRAQLKEMTRIMRWNGLPIGHEDDLFSEESNVDRRPTEEKAFAAGQKAGMRGESLRVPDEWSTSPDVVTAWGNGWRAGQDALFDIKEPKQDNQPPVDGNGEPVPTDAAPEDPAPEGTGEAE